MSDAFAYSAPPRRRRRKVALITAALLGVPAIALAAWLFIARGNFGLQVQTAQAAEGAITVTDYTLNPLDHGEALLAVSNPNPFQTNSISWSDTDNTGDPECQVRILGETRSLTVPANGNAQFSVPLIWQTPLAQREVCQGRTLNFSMTAQLTG
jgi:hypothetical protein